MPHAREGLAELAGEGKASKRVVRNRGLRERQPPGESGKQLQRASIVAVAVKINVQQTQLVFSRVSAVRRA